MSYRCVLVDDEKPARERLKRLLADRPEFEVVGEAGDAASAIRLIDELRPDLCFLDVQMPEGDGFEVLRSVQRVPSVIFTTAYDEYAVRAFEVNSLDYLLKPFGKRRFAEALDRAEQALERPAGGGAERVVELLDEIRSGLAARPATPGAGGSADRITARRGSKILLLELDEILYFEAEDTLVFARAEGGRHLVERTLADLERQLSPAFFRAHRRFLVNMGRIAEILPAEAGTYRLVLRDEQRSVIPLSRRQARKLKELLPW
jgi:DNA-binding LytR/AlgR family response regulator